MDEKLTGPGASSTSPPSYPLLRELLDELPGAEEIAYTSLPQGQLLLEAAEMAERAGEGTLAFRAYRTAEDNPASPEPDQGWSPERCKMLARDCLAALLEWLEAREG